MAKISNPAPYDVTNWYWLVGGDGTQVYSSASNTFVPISDATYQNWLTAGQIYSPSRRATAIDSLASLSDVLSAAGLPVPSGGSTSDVQKNTLFSDIPKAVQVWAFAIDNRVRVLEGQPTRTAAQFKAYVKSLIS